LKEQLVARGITRTELHEAARIRCQDLVRLVAVDWFGHPVGELGGSLAEHGVVDGALRLEVGVHRWRSDSCPAGQIAKRQARKTFLVHQCPGCSDNRISRRASSTFPPVSGLGEIAH
jgi:hypothetical protein